VTVPDAAIELEPAESQDDELPTLPTLPKKRPKPKSIEPAGGAKHARKKTTVERETPSFSWAQLLTGDIRPILVGGGSILLGIAAIATPFVLPAFTPEALAHEQDRLVSRNELLGSGVIGGMYRLFGQTGVIVLFIVIGLTFIAGGVWFMRNYEFEDDD
jgi:hypothetical protein